MPNPFPGFCVEAHDAFAKEIVPESMSAVIVVGGGADGQVDVAKSSSALIIVHTFALPVDFHESFFHVSFPNSLFAEWCGKPNVALRCERQTLSHLPAASPSAAAPR